MREVIEAARARHRRARSRRARRPAAPGDPPQLVAASERAREVLGWEPRSRELETMIADAWAWHQANPDGYAGHG